MKTFSEYFEEKLNNTNIYVCEASLSRMLSLADQPFAILTGYKAFWDDGKKRTKQENIQQNFVLKNKLNSQGMGAHQLIGHWRECTLEDVPYEECPTDKLIDVIERSFFVPMPSHTDFDEFKMKMIELGEEFKQNAILLGDGENVYVVDINTGSLSNLGKNISLNKIGQGYSQHVLKQNVPFVFEGFEQFHNNYARQGAKNNGLLLPPLNEEFKVITAKVIS
jgi:hypothetical protein